MNVMKEAYETALREDAVMGAGSVGAIGDVSAPTPSVDTDVVSVGKGISRDDVLGKYDSSKGVFGNNDFNIPKNALGKGKVLKRYEIPSLKKKGHKNPYIKGMKVLNEEQLNNIIEKVLNDQIDEEFNEIFENDLHSAMTDIKQQFKSPTDVQAFIDSNDGEVQKFKDSTLLTSLQKNVFSKAWDFIKYAASKGAEFIKKHWKKILLLILIIVAILWFGQTKAGTSLGIKLFGDGYTTGIEKFKNAIKHAMPFAKDSTEISKNLTKAAFVLPLEDLIKVKEWIPAPENLIPDETVSVALDTAGIIFWTQLTDGRSAYAFGNNPGYYIPKM